MTDSKRKKIKPNLRDEAFYYLSLEIGYAEGVDAPILYPTLPIQDCFYQVVVWVGSGEEFATREVRGNVHALRWGAKARIPLGRFLDPEELSVEVVRLNSWSDPGTSEGEVVVGRVRIPIPVVEKKKGGRFGLVRPNGDGCRGEGHIGISMEVMKISN